MERSDRIKILRILCGYSQDALAKILGLSQGNVATWERKGMFPRDPEIARKLAAALEAPVGYLAFGDPHMRSAAWEPQPPQNPRHLNGYLSEIERIFPAFCEENHISHCGHYSAENGVLIFFGKTGQPFSFLLLLVPQLASCFFQVTKNLNTHEISGLESLVLGFLENMGPEDLDLFLRLAEGNNLSVDKDSIHSAFLSAKRNRKLLSGDDTKCLVNNAFMHYFNVLEEFDKPTSWSPKIISPGHPTLVDVQSTIFGRLYEEIERRSLVWGGALDEDLANMVRCFLKGQGFKEKEPGKLASEETTKSAHQK